MNKIVRTTIIAAVIGGAAFALTACGTSNAATDTAATASSVSAVTPAPTTATVTKVTVPSLAGLAPEVATAKLKAFGLTASITGDLSNPAFGVLMQEPAAATQVEPGIVVKVTIGESPAQAMARQAAEAKAAADAEAARVAAEAAAAAQAEADRVAAEQAAASEVPDWAGIGPEGSVWNGEAWVAYDENGELIGDPGYTPEGTDPNWQGTDQGWYDERGWVSPETAQRALDAGIPYGGEVPGYLRCGTICGEAPTSGEVQSAFACLDGTTLSCQFDDPKAVLRSAGTPESAVAAAEDRASIPADPQQACLNSGGVVSVRGVCYTNWADAQQAGE